MPRIWAAAADLRSATQGRATYTMEFAKYGEVPSGIAETVMARSQN